MRSTNVQFSAKRIDKIHVCLETVGMKAVIDI